MRSAKRAAPTGSVTGGVTAEEVSGAPSSGVRRGGASAASATGRAAKRATAPSPPEGAADGASHVGRGAAGAPIGRRKRALSMLDKRINKRTSWPHLTRGDSPSTRRHRPADGAGAGGPPGDRGVDGDATHAGRWRGWQRSGAVRLGRVTRAFGRHVTEDEGDEGDEGDDEAGAHAEQPVGAAHDDDADDDNAPRFPLRFM